MLFKKIKSERHKPVRISCNQKIVASRHTWGNLSTFGYSKVDVRVTSLRIRHYNTPEAIAKHTLQFIIGCGLLAIGYLINFVKLLMSVCGRDWPKPAISQ